MSDTHVIHNIRPAIDILADVDRIIKQYPPMVQDRPHILIEVDGDTIHLSGHTRTSVTHLYITHRLKSIVGVQSIDASALYSDDKLRLAVGEHLPSGVFVQMIHGTAILSGELPPEVDDASLAASLRAIPGIRDVVMQWHG